MVSVVFDGFEVPYVHRWPLGEEQYEGAIKFRAEVEGETVPVLVAFGKKEAFGALRERILVVVKDRVMLELVGADDYERNGLLVGVLKKLGTEEQLQPGENVPLELTRFTIVLHRRYVSRGFNSRAVLFNAADIKGMIDYGLARARLEGVI